MWWGLILILTIVIPTGLIQRYFIKKTNQNMVFLKMIPLQEYNIEESWSNNITFLRILSQLKIPRWYDFFIESAWFRFLIICKQGKISFYYSVPKERVTSFKAMVQSSLPSIMAVECTDPFLDLQGQHHHGQEITPFYRDIGEIMPFKILLNSREVAQNDPLTSVLSAMGAGNTESDVSTIIDITMRSQKDGVLLRMRDKFEHSLFQREDGLQNTISFLEAVWHDFTSNGKKYIPPSLEKKNLSSHEKQMLDNLKFKTQPPERAHRIQMRFGAIGNNEKQLTNIVNTMVASLESFRYINYYVAAKGNDPEKIWLSIKEGEAQPYSGFILCTTELASIAHIIGNENPLYRYVERSVSRVVEPPQVLVE